MEERATASRYPAPPSFYQHFTPENLEALKEMEKSGGFVRSLVLSELNEQGDSVAEAVDRLIAGKNSY